MDATTLNTAMQTATAAASASASRAAAAALPNGLQRLADVQNAGKAIPEQMGQAQFLTLFTTQLQNQNPLDPVKNEAFVAQLAQFSQLEATTQMRDQMAAMAKTQQTERFLTGSHLIGRQVMAPDGPARLEPGRSITGLVSLPQGADRVTLDVYDAAGQSVWQSSLGRQQPGDLRLSWDGLDMNGKAMPAGDYRVLATVNNLGKVTQVPIATPSTVRSVTWSPALDDLILEVENGSTVPLSQVTRVDAAPRTSP